jgi:hypothetical protein
LGKLLPIIKVVARFFQSLDSNDELYADPDTEYSHYTSRQMKSFLKARNISYSKQSEEQIKTTFLKHLIGLVERQQLSGMNL